MNSSVLSMIPITAPRTSAPTPSRREDRKERPVGDQRSQVGGLIVLELAEHRPRQPAPAMPLLKPVHPPQQPGFRPRRPAVPPRLRSVHAAGHAAWPHAARDMTTRAPRAAT